MKKTRRDKDKTFTKRNNGVRYTVVFCDSTSKTDRTRKRRCIIGVVHDQFFMTCSRTPGTSVNQSTKYCVWFISKLCETQERSYKS